MKKFNLEDIIDKWLLEEINELMSLWENVSERIYDILDEKNLLLPLSFISLLTIPFILNYLTK